jgi:hypothetical protein
MSTLLDRLVDDAAIFPPGEAPLDRAVEQHLAHRAGPYARLVGVLLVRDADVADVPALARQALTVGVIGTSGPRVLVDAIAELQAAREVTVAGAEIRVRAGDDLLLATQGLLAALDGLPSDVTVSVELPRLGSVEPVTWRAAADEITDAGRQVKLRAGGVAADAYPDEAELAAALGVLAWRPFKLTAGLHRAVRNTQLGTGFEQHGFVNVLVAVHRLLGGATPDAAAAVLAERDGAPLAAEVLSWSADEATQVRAAFRGFGSCSITEPHADLARLGLVA